MIVLEPILYGPGIPRTLEEDKVQGYLLSAHIAWASFVSNPPIILSYLSFLGRVRIAETPNFEKYKKNET